MTRITGEGEKGRSDAGPESNTVSERNEADAGAGATVSSSDDEHADAGVHADAGDDEDELTSSDDAGLPPTDTDSNLDVVSVNTHDYPAINIPNNGLGFGLTDVTNAAGLATPHWEPSNLSSYPCNHALFTTAGAAAVDINADGWTDLFVTRLEQPNLLYVNNGDGTFQDIAPSLRLNINRWSSSPAFADVDGDADLDLFVTTAGPAKAMLFINQGDKFTEEAAARGVDVGRMDGCSELTSASFGDYNHDGALDLFVGHWTSNEGNFNSLFKNDGTGHFSNVTAAAGLNTLQPRGYSSGFMDADDDGWEDLFVVADFWNSRLFHNNQDGTFSDVTAAAGVGVEEDGMGSALGDVNGDGYPDWFVSNIDEPGITVGNRLYINRGDGTFDDESSTYGVTQGGWGWGAQLFDINNDGQLDASNVGGWIDQDQVPSLWLGGSQLPWQNVTTPTGLSRASNGRAYVPLDFDRDGDLDLFIANNGASPILYRNDGASNRHWLVVNAVGHSSNAYSIGARVELRHANGKTQYRWITANNNFLGHGPFEAHFGLGDDPGPFTVSVFWPASGKTRTHGLVPPDQVITLEEP